MLQNATPLRKSAPRPPDISDEHVSCLAPARRNAPRSSSNVQCLPSFLEMLQTPQVLLTFDQVHNPLRLPRETTPERPKVVRTCGACNILTSKRPSRHNGVHFFDMSTSKSAPRPSVFNTFGWLANVLRATRACTFSASQLALYALTSKCASSHNGVQLFISHLARWLRTRRFSEPTFRPSGATSYSKNTMSRDFPTFSRTCIFFLLTLSLLWSSLFFSSLLFSDSSHLCFSICPYCRKFDF